MVINTNYSVFKFSIVGCHDIRKCLAYSIDVIIILKLSPQHKVMIVTEHGQLALLHLQLTHEHMRDEFMT